MTAPSRTGLLIDSNLLVLYVVGSVNPARIKLFKRTSKYDVAHFKLLCQLLASQSCLYTVPHILAEVSNLTDLGGLELLAARSILRDTIAVLSEEKIPSVTASSAELYERLGLTDSSIAAAAQKTGCEVLTDDFDLYQALWGQGITAHNFMHLCAEVMAY